MNDKQYTTKQMGDACEMLVAGHLTLAGIPAMKVPDNWPGYDVIAQPAEKTPQRISVKSHTWKEEGSRITYNCSDQFDWLAIVLVRKGLFPQFFLISRNVADVIAYGNNGSKRIVPTDKAAEKFGRYENNFTLNPSPIAAGLTLKPRALQPKGETSLSIEEVDALDDRQ